MGVCVRAYHFKINRQISVDECDIKSWISWCVVVLRLFLQWHTGVCGNSGFLGECPDDCLPAAGGLGALGVA